jgi:hypothetical protein
VSSVGIFERHRVCAAQNGFSAWTGSYPLLVKRATTRASTDAVLRSSTREVLRGGRGPVDASALGELEAVPRVGKSEHHAVVACVVLESGELVESQAVSIEVHDGFESARGASESKLRDG